MIIPLLTAIHVISVLIWIGGVVFVTIIVFPMIQRMEESMEKVMFFQGVEHRFGKIAKLCVAIAGITGFALLHLMKMEAVLFTKQGIAVALMLFLWTLYLLILIFEGRLFKILFQGKAQHNTSEIFKTLAIFHWFIMGISLFAVFLGVYKGHGG
ncbi:hypothetical protein MCHI_003070 [Candidatus Magnetoovum chiemensis]|nr:hypothetical protein MCHI_003070 [Candidatus Magnetoovum chiemensis]